MTSITGPAAEPFEYVVSIDPIPAEITDEDRAVVAVIPASWGKPHLLLGYDAFGRAARLVMTVSATGDGRTMEAYWHLNADGRAVVTMGRLWYGRVIARGQSGPDPD